jgi:hypothetical protein
VQQQKNYNFASYEVLLVTTAVATHIPRLIFELIAVVFLCVLPSKYTLKGCVSITAWLHGLIWKQT